MDRIIWLFTGRPAGQAIPLPRGRRNRKNSQRFFLIDSRNANIFCLINFIQGQSGIRRPTTKTDKPEEPGQQEEPDLPEEMDRREEMDRPEEMDLREEIDRPEKPNQKNSLTLNCLLSQQDFLNDRIATAANTDS